MAAKKTLAGAGTRAGITGLGFAPAGAAFGLGQGLSNDLSAGGVAKNAGLGALFGGGLGVAGSLAKSGVKAGRQQVTKIGRNPKAAQEPVPTEVQAGNMRSLSQPGAKLPLTPQPSQLREMGKEFATGARGQEGFVKVAPGTKEVLTPEAQEFKTKIVSGNPQTTKLESIGQKTKAAKNSVREKLFDRYDAVRRLASDYEKISGKKLEVFDNPYKQARLASGIPGAVQTKFDELGSVLRQSPDIGLTKELGVAKRIVGDRSGIKNPISVESAARRIDQIKQKLGPENFAKADEVVNKVVALHDDMLKYMADNGIIGKESFEAIKAKNQNYFSKFDVIDYLTENADNLGHGKSFNVAKQDLIKSQKGTERVISDPIEATIRQWSKTIDLVERNRVGQAIYKIANDPNFKDAQVLKAGESVPAGAEKFQTFVDGQKVEMVVPKDVGNALKHLTAEQADFVSRMARGAMGGSVLRKAATSLNVPFALIKNPLRDFKTFAFNSQAVPLHRIGAAWVRGFLDSIKQGDVFKEFMAAKGGQSTFFRHGDETVVKTAKDILRPRSEKLGRTIINPKKLFGAMPAIENAGFRFEMAPRLAEFKYTIAKQMGVKPSEVAGLLKKGNVPPDVLQDAAFQGRNITVDFSEAGVAGQIANQWVPFLNARLQGTRKTAQAIIRNPGRAVTTAAIATLTPAVLSYVWSREKHSDIYDVIPQYVKDNYFLLVYGDGKDEEGNPTDVLKIPKADVDRVFGNTLENVMEFMYKKDPKGAGATILEGISTASPIDFVRDGKINFSVAASGLLPPVPKGALESAANYSFFKDGPVVSEKLQKLPAGEQVYPNTTPVAKKIGEVTGWSPAKIDNFMRNVIANQVQQVTNPTGTIAGTLIGTPGNNVENKFYAIRERVQPERQSTSNRINEAIKGGDVDKARQIADGYNSSVDDEFKDFTKQYGKYMAEDLKEAQGKLKINLTPQAIKNRQTRLRKDQN